MYACVLLGLPTKLCGLLIVSLNRFACLAHQAISLCEHSDSSGRKRTKCEAPRHI
jgi:hypothetical protein